MGGVQLRRVPGRPGSRRAVAGEDPGSVHVCVSVRAERLDVQRLPTEAVRPAGRADRRRRHARPRLRRVVGPRAEPLQQRHRLPPLLCRLPGRRPPARPAGGVAAVRLPVGPGSSHPELQAARHAVHVPVGRGRHPGPRHHAGRGGGRSSGGGERGRAVLPAAAGVAGQAGRGGVRRAVRRLCEAGGPADGGGVEELHGPGGAGRCAATAGRRRRHVRRQPTHPQRPARRAGPRRTPGVRPGRAGRSARCCCRTSGGRGG